MAIIVFIVDTSASMANKNYRGCSALDMSKSFITEFVKMRGRDISAKSFDRFYLVSTEEYPGCVKELKNIWREGSLHEQLKQLRTRGRSRFSEAIMNSFKFVNLYRSTTGIDNYGYGRFPYFIEPVVFISICDGSAVDDIPINTKLEFRGRNELTKEAFRWDHRLYSVVLRLSAECTAFVPGSRAEQDKDVIQRMCVGTGGDSFSITNHRQMSPCVETLLTAMQFMGVNVRFQCPTVTSRLNGEADSPEARLRKRLETRPLTKVIVRIVSGKPSIAHWPIPEAFWHKRLDGNVLPQRSCHPVIAFGLEPVTSIMLQDFPFDKYELQPSPVVDYLLEKFRDMKPDQGLHVFVHNSGKTDGYGKPFGFLKMMSTGTGVNLFLMPYNYPVLMMLMQELKAEPSVRANPDWRRRLDYYLESVPPYYINALRKNLQKFKVSGGILDDQQSQGNTYPPQIMKMLNTLRPIAKEEFDRIGAILTANANAQASSGGHMPQLTYLERRIHISLTKHWRNDQELPQPAVRRDRRDRRDPRSNGVEEEPFKDPEDMIEMTAAEKATTVQVHFAESRLKPANISTYRNPLVLTKEQIADNVPRMLKNIQMLLRQSNIPLLEGGRAGVNINLHQAEELHTLPISQMGNYEEYIKAQHEVGWTPLRDVETKPVRAHVFGNPFKTDKKLAIDEVGEGPVDNSASRETRRDRRGGAAGRPPKRKPGPLSVASMNNWRERRKSLSTCSSVVSDLSYTSDLDVPEDKPSTSENGHPPVAAEAPTNGFTETLTNGNGEVKTKVMVEVWGLEDETEDGNDEEPPAKKVNLDPQKGKLAQDLSYDDMRQMKLRLAEIVRKPNNGVTVLREILKVSAGLSLRDNLDLVEFSLRDSRRFKRKALSDDLDKEVTRLRKLVKLTNSSL